MSTLAIDPDLEELTVDANEAPADTEPKHEEKEDPRLVTLREQLAQREKELEAALAGRDELAQKAFGSEREAAEQRADAASMRLTTLQQARARSVDAEAQIKADLARANEIADYTKVAELQALLADKVADRKWIEQGLYEVEREAKRYEEAAKNMPEAPQPSRRQAGSTDPYQSDKFRALPKPAQDWLSTNKDKGYLDQNGNATPKLLSAYYAAQAEGLSEASPKFYEHMERVLAPRQADDYDDAPPDQPKRQQKKPSMGSMAAPVSNGGGSDNGGNAPPRSVRLKAEFADLAKTLGITPDEYVKGAWAATQTGPAEDRARARAHYNRIRS